MLYFSCGKNVRVIQQMGYILGQENEFRQFLNRKRKGAGMASNQKEWAEARDRLVSAVKNLGFPGELGEAMAKNLGSPKAMGRMTAYLENEKPGRVEVAVDEMLAICSERNAWRENLSSRNIGV